MYSVHFHQWVVLSVVLLALLASQWKVGAAEPVGEFPIRRVSLSTTELEGNQDSFYGVASDGGAYIAFSSYADNVVPNDNNGVSDVFLRDTANGTTTRITVANTGGDTDGHSEGFSISADGQYVLINSEATNLIGGDTNGTYDGFIYDRIANAMARVTLRNNGTEGNGDSFILSLSSNGRYVGFVSLATNLVPNDTNGTLDCFIRDLVNNTTQRISVPLVPNPDGACEWVDLSATGRYVAFGSQADNLILGDSNGASDIFVLDRQTDVLERVSVHSNGNEANGESINPTISDDGQRIAFYSNATNLVSGDSNGSNDVFVHDRSTGETSVVSVSSQGGIGSADSNFPFLSEDGLRVVFYSEAVNLVPDDTNGVFDAFVHELTTHTTTRISISRNNNQANDETFYTTISANGSAVVLASYASNLVPNDTNGVQDVFWVQLPPANTPTPTPIATPTVTMTPSATGTIVPPTGTATPTTTPTGTLIPPTTTPTGTVMLPTATATSESPASTPTVTVTATGELPLHTLYLPLTRR
jgi:Tol biopolymer transport system component